MFGMRVGLDVGGNALHHFDPGILQGGDFVGIIRNEPHLAYAKLL